ncbi:GAF domain-containing protein [Leeia oryzae]|uniref:GAF domain-containing protein n=1 Tax=Leeia oryzae TaxID=356662 RepID=UPI000527A804|nr:GAF domain-containing protein [Leeia oryzae]
MQAEDICIENLRDCFEGAVPSAIATCSPDGTPNITYISQVQYVDRQHVALTFQFFNKTRQNILANPMAMLTVADPFTGSRHRLKVRYLHTETSGPLFESMKAKLAGIASHTGMADVFRLQGADLYRVESVDSFISQVPSARRNKLSFLPKLREVIAQLNTCTDLNELFDTALTLLNDKFAISHAMLLKLDEAGQCLFTMASRGYETSGIGSEIPVGHGVIGVAARERTPIRISHMTSDYTYGKAVRESAEALGLQHHLETAIPMPGLPESRSQMAVPILAGDSLYGVLYVESPQDLYFSYDDEDALMLMAYQLGWTASGLTCMEAVADTPALSLAERVMLPEGQRLQVRYFMADHSVFLNDDYLIKGVAGAIFWRLVSLYQQQQRNEFTNRELRLDASLNLPDLVDNLEARLVLLQRRLEEREASVRIVKTGRGRFHLQVNQLLDLHCQDK